MGCPFLYIVPQLSLPLHHREPSAHQEMSLESFIIQPHFPLLISKYSDILSASSSPHLLKQHLQEGCDLLSERFYWCFFSVMLWGLFDSGCFAFSVIALFSRSVQSVLFLLGLMLVPYSWGLFPMGHGGPAPTIIPVSLGGVRTRVMEPMVAGLCSPRCSADTALTVSTAHSKCLLLMFYTFAVFCDRAAP